MVRVCRNIHKSLGSIKFGPSQKEAASLKERPSIFVNQDIKAGSTLTAKNLKICRPALGLSPRNWSSIVGKKTKVDLKFGDPLLWEHLSPKTTEK
jgi:sialic acid synthase SpsE